MMFQKWISCFYLCQVKASFKEQAWLSFGVFIISNVSLLECFTVGLNRSLQGFTLNVIEATSMLTLRMNS